MRLPIRQIQMYLETVHQVTMSSGEIVELLHRIASHIQPALGWDQSPNPEESSLTS